MSGQNESGAMVMVHNCCGAPFCCVEKSRFYAILISAYLERRDKIERFLMQINAA
jgi:hypothetical protein